ncbi:hypothetical protein PR048_029998 [Dryococelus australis]|uniref:Uncharacterized protein n=1 Tax=Dryococelus australis TaxID=614101 RepID=A0ABQ9G7Q6_9NEOP|nr:hypothetical protein PR048_029998 [Dryococelus australis]
MHAPLVAIAVLGSTECERACSGDHEFLRVLPFSPRFNPASVPPRSQSRNDSPVLQVGQLTAITVSPISSLLTLQGSYVPEVAPGFSHVGIMPDDAAGRRGFSRRSPISPGPCIPSLHHTRPRFTPVGSRDLDVKSRQKSLRSAYCRLGAPFDRASRTLASICVIPRSKHLLVLSATTADDAVQTNTQHTRQINSAKGEKTISFQSKHARSETNPDSRGVGVERGGGEVPPQHSESNVVTADSCRCEEISNWLNWYRCTTSCSRPISAGLDVAGRQRELVSFFEADKCGKEDTARASFKCLVGANRKVLNWRIISGVGIRLCTVTNDVDVVGMMLMVDGDVGVAGIVDVSIACSGVRYDTSLGTKAVSGITCGLNGNISVAINPDTAFLETSLQLCDGLSAKRDSTTVAHYGSYAEMILVATNTGNTKRKSSLDGSFLYAQSERALVQESAGGVAQRVVDGYGCNDGVVVAMNCCQESGGLSLDDLEWPPNLAHLVELM